MAATVLDIDIDSGGEFTEIITWYDEDAARVDLSAYSAALTIKDADDIELLTIDTSGVDSRIDLEIDSTQNDDYSEVSPSSVGVITLHIYADDTALLSGLQGVYDLIMTPGTGTDHNIKLLKGSVNIDKLITS